MRDKPKERPSRRLEANLIWDFTVVLSFSREPSSRGHSRDVNHSTQGADHVHSGQQQIKLP